MLDPPAPSTIIAAIPRWLGRRPVTAETVLVGFSPMDANLAVCLALHPEREPIEEVLAMHRLVVDGAEAVAIVQTTGAEDPATEQLRERMLRFLTYAAERYGLEVIGVLVVVPPQRGRAGYWRSLPDRTRHPIVDETVTHEFRSSRRRLGAAPLAHINGAAGVRYGTNASCSCGGWSWYTNNAPPSRGGARQAREAFDREHLPTLSMPTPTPNPTEENP